ncbi:MAG: winged helix-turn-helix domain-containing protein [Microcystis aeruginosa G13-07]|nr:winged helix-turn-helix domain-containing protein [Microcystis aeruginosa G13-11]NCS09335.1 winged helix-turn-helix domain-containing protein [Microcystis aeruginosa G13-07]
MGFTSYKEIYFWLSVVRDISVSYTTVYRLVRQEFEAQLKVPRPRNPRQLPGEVDEFKANLSKGLKALLDRESEKVKRYEKVSFWCEDESRFGGNTIARNKITLFGVKPIGNFQYN